MALSTTINAISGSPPTTASGDSNDHINDIALTPTSTAPAPASGAKQAEQTKEASTTTATEENSSNSDPISSILELVGGHIKASNDINQLTLPVIMITPDSDAGDNPYAVCHPECECGSCPDCLDIEHPEPEYMPTEEAALGNWDGMKDPVPSFWTSTIKSMKYMWAAPGALGNWDGVKNKVPDFWKGTQEPKGSEPATEESERQRIHHIKESKERAREARNDFFNALSAVDSEEIFGVSGTTYNWHSTKVKLDKLVERRGGKLKKLLNGLGFGLGRGRV